MCNNWMNRTLPLIKGVGRVVRLLVSGHYSRNCRIPDNARRVGQGSRATRTSAMSGRQVCGQTPGGPAISQYIRGWLRRLDIDRRVKQQGGSLTSVVIGTLAVGGDCWEEAAAHRTEPQGRDRASCDNRDDRTPRIDRARMANNVLDELFDAGRWLQ
jgi:hypothetical protein